MNRPPRLPVALSHRTVRWRGLVALVAVSMMAAGIGQTGAGREVLQKAGLVGKASDYTSLAFADPQSLPGQLRSKGAAADVSFVIRNIGGAPREYHWSMVLVQQRHTRRLAAGSVSVAAGEAAVINRSANISCTPGQMQVVVSLAHPAEHIDAWAVCPSHRS